MTRAYVRDPLTVPERRCARCGLLLPLDAFRVVRGRWPSSWCRSCSVERTRQWRADRHDAINARRRAAYAAARESR